MEGAALLVVGLLLVLGVAAAFAAARASVPMLVVFLLLGMLLGSEGPGGVELGFEDADLVRTIGVFGLVAILFEGGLTTAWRDVRRVLAPTAALSTAGVAITAAVTGLAAYLLFDLSLEASLLLGAVVGSTDAAAVFATLRFSALRPRLARLLEAESGSNDPMAVALTLGLIALIETAGYGAGDLVGAIAVELAIGLGVGLALAVLAARAFARLPLGLGPFAPVLSIATAAIAFGAADVLGGSGFLCVYVVALAVGNTISPFRASLVAFHQGLAFLAQIVLFVVLGILVFPSQLVHVVVPGLALALVLVFVARPVAVWLCTPRGLDARERTLVSWAGLRGAVPIVLATFPLSAGVPESVTIFNAVFFVVLVSVLLQGPTFEPLARRLGLVVPGRPVVHAPIEVGAIRALGADLLELTVEAGDAVDGLLIRDLGLPADAIVALIVRGERAIPPRGTTRLEPGDRLFVVARPRLRPELEQLFAGDVEGEGTATLPTGRGR
jgi:potassium/hydrogen antiporter